MATVFELDLPPIPKLILLALADFADEETGECWPSQTRLAKKASISERTIRSHIAPLVEDGYIEILARGDGRGHSTRYRLNLIRLKAAALAALQDEAKAEADALKAEADAVKADPTIRRSVIDPPKDPSSTVLPRARAREPLRFESTRDELPDGAREAMAAYENLAGTFTKPVLDEMLDYLARGTPPAWIVEACAVAAGENVRRWSYVKAIIERWQREGFKAPRENGRAQGHAPRRGVSTGGPRRKW